MIIFYLHVKVTTYKREREQKKCEKKKMVDLTKQARMKNKTTNIFG